MKYALYFYFCALSSLLNAQSHEEITLLKIPSGVLEGTLLLPDSLVYKNKLPLAFIIAGSGPTDRNGNNPMMENNSLKLLAEGLANKGVASFRYDKRGIGESHIDSLNEKDMRFSHFVSDAEAWLQALKMDKRFGAISIIGHSEGSLIGMIAAKKANISGFISIAGVGNKASQIIEEQLGAQPEFIQTLSEPILKQLQEGQLVEEVTPMLYALFRPSIQPYLISWFAIDPQEEIKKLNIPILILQGTTDIQVGIAEAELLSQANPRAKKVIIEGMNHILKPAALERAKNLATYQNPKLPIAPLLLQEIVTFIRKLE